MNSAGASDQIVLGDWVASSGVDIPTIPTYVITNADQGVIASFIALTGEPVIATVTGTSVSVGPGPSIAGQNDAVAPALQAEDGSYVGTAYVGDDRTPYIVAFDESGTVRWTVPNDEPKIGTDDGGVIAKSGIMYDQNGGASGFSVAAAIYSWTSGAYEIGSVHRFPSPPQGFALGWFPSAGDFGLLFASHFPTDWRANDEVKNDILNDKMWAKFARSTCASILSQGMSALAIPNYTLTAIRQKERQTNFYYLGQSNVGALTLQQVTGYELSNTQTITSYLGGANAATVNMGATKQTAVILKAGLLPPLSIPSTSHPEFTLVHELILHAWAAQPDDVYFNNTFFQQKGLWRPDAATTWITDWLSTDCTCTPGRPGTTCTANTAKW